jgi:branched-chain amino acid transport system ATP-binding protein
MLEVNNVSASYGVVKALARVSLNIGASQIVCLLGANGAGKTTLLNCICGVIRPIAGRISFQGEDITRCSTHGLVRRGLLQVPEGREIFPSLSVYDNLILGRWTRKSGGVPQAVDRAYSYFPVLEARAKQAAGTLSGGEQQMLMIARAVMCEPKLLLFDEPSLGLSPLLVQNVFAIIRRLHAEGVPILLVEQNVHLALSVSNYAYILENGEISLHGTAAEMARNSRVNEAYLGSSH